MFEKRSLIRYQKALKPQGLITGFPKLQDYQQIHDADGRCLVIEVKLPGADQSRIPNGCGATV